MFSLNRKLLWCLNSVMTLTQDGNRSGKWFNRWFFSPISAVSLFANLVIGLLHRIPASQAPGQHPPVQRRQTSVSGGRVKGNHKYKHTTDNVCHKATHHGYHIASCWSGKLLLKRVANRKTVSLPPCQAARVSRSMPLLSSASPRISSE